MRVNLGGLDFMLRQDFVLRDFGWRLDGCGDLFNIFSPHHGLFSFLIQNV